MAMEDLAPAVRAADDVVEVEQPWRSERGETRRSSRKERLKHVRSCPFRWVRRRDFGLPCSWLDVSLSCCCSDDWFMACVLLLSGCSKQSYILSFNSMHARYILFQACLCLKRFNCGTYILRPVFPWAASRCNTGDRAIEMQVHTSYSLVHTNYRSCKKRTYFTQHFGMFRVFRHS